ncbi:MAG TPA: transglutaminase N-terminal domain-containing protein, partial [Fibrobacteraceae bacterium]|nr:transglutaminase N-terminal domain-containing protein [Fibrobacteraceae bacterium]
MRTYRIRHSTGYFYDHPVMRSRNLCLLLPRYLSYQTVLYESLVVNPEPEPAFELDDGLGNRLYDFTVVKPHINFEVVLDLRVTIQERIWKEGCAKLGDALYLQSDYHNSSHLEASIFTFP